MTLEILALLAGGLLALAFGGEWLVRGAVAAAERLGVSQLLIGLTIVGFGTSAPELVTSVLAALDGSPGIAVGNVVGSNTANSLLIVGVTALVRPIMAARAAFTRDSAVMIAATMLAAAALWSGQIARAMGIAFVVALVAYVIVTYQQERREKSSAQAPGLAAAQPPRSVDGPQAPRSVDGAHAPRSLARALAALAGGLALTVLGARWLVAGAIDLSRGLGVDETIIGLTIVALGTSLPELVTCALAARRGHSDIALGNVLGSNLYNLLGILGVTAAIVPIEVPARVLGLDLWVMVASGFLLVAVTITGWRVSRIEGGALLALYAAYTAWLALTAASIEPG